MEKSPDTGDVADTKQSRFRIDSVGSEQKRQADSMPESGRSIILGLCAMAKKVKSKPMTAILTRLRRFSHLQLVVFDERMILSDDVESWPVVDALISFYSHGFPLDKAIRYAELHRPYLVNDLRSQYLLMNRRQVYRMLQQRDIPVVRHAAFVRSELHDPGQVLVEHEDHIVVNGETFNKPFVEKPVDAEDHNIHIYFPSAAGGGSVRLFRKIADRSSTYHSDSRIRAYGDYIYEDFMPTDGTDVKVYAIGKDYAHAEARKSPALDGKVERDAEGKEMRYPIILSAKEKIIAKKVVEAFNQNVCGFDLLRANGMSYVCDVNGFSFVKSSKKYYDDCAFMLGVMVTSAIAPSLSLSIKYPAMDRPPLIRTTFGTVMELRCVIAVIRHGDRTPKQKVKVEVFHPAFFELFNRHRRSANEAKLKKPSVMQELLNVVRDLLQDVARRPSSHSVRESKPKLRQVRQVLEMYGHFSGINRKAQLKFTPAAGHAATASCHTGCLMLVLKWGGELTAEGRSQAEKLGRAFREIYPGGESYSQKDGLGLLRLHSTYRHDLKIYASDEGRVQTTAAAFAKGFLDLEGPLTPILVQMVKSAHTNGLLDSDNDSRKYMAVMKERIGASLEVERDWSEADVRQVAPHGTASLLHAMLNIRNPGTRCRQMLDNMRCICRRLERLHKDPDWLGAQMYHDESWEMALQRWRKLVKDFRVNGRFAFSKVPDIYDNIKYDLLHNSGAVDMPEARQLYFLAKNMADIVVPSEYGIRQEEKLAIAQRICTPLLRKILADTQHTSIFDVDDCCSTRLNTAYSPNVTSPERFVRTRLYFTSESHIHSLLTILRCGGLLDAASDPQWERAMDFCNSVPELNYLTQIVFMVYENPQQPKNSDTRFHVELHFSPGSVSLDCADEPRPPTSGFRPKINHRRSQPADAAAARDSCRLLRPASASASPCHSGASTPSKLRLGRFEMSPSSFRQRRPTGCRSSCRRADRPDGQIALSDRLGLRCRTGPSASPTSGSPPTSATPSRGDSLRLPRSKSWAGPLHRTLDRASSGFSDADVVADVEEAAGSSYDTFHGAADLRKVFGLQPASVMPLKPSTLHLFSTQVICGLAQSDPQLETQSSEVASSRSERTEQTASTSASQHQHQCPHHQHQHRSQQQQQQQQQQDSEDEYSGQARLCTAPCVPEIYPLETLHNSLTLRHLEMFLRRQINAKLRAPWG